MHYFPCTDIYSVVIKQEYHRVSIEERRSKLLEAFQANPSM
jgi:hypothetical protein